NEFRFPLWPNPQITKRFRKGVFLLITGGTHSISLNFSKWFLRLYHYYSLQITIETLFVFSATLNYDKALVAADTLLNESRWSRTMYSYFSAAVLSSFPRNSLTGEQNERMLQLMRQV